MNDPLFDRVRALPRVDVDETLAERVRLRALATLEAHPARPRLRQLIATAVVASGVLAYFGWAVVFVLAR